MRHRNEAILDKKWIENRKQDLKKTANPAGENFEAVATFKEYCDKEDQLLVFRINDRRCNPKLPSYVFKTSNVRMLIAENMNREGDHFMKDEYCYFDGKVKRCKNFVTLTASTYHPLLERQVVLAVMEAERELLKTLSYFGCYLMKLSVRRQEQKIPYLFQSDGVRLWPGQI